MQFHSVCRWNMITRWFIGGGGGGGWYSIKVLGGYPFLLTLQYHHVINYGYFYLMNVIYYLQGICSAYDIIMMCRVDLLKFIYNLVTPQSKSIATKPSPKPSPTHRSPSHRLHQNNNYTKVKSWQKASLLYYTFTIIFDALRGVCRLCLEIILSICLPCSSHLKLCYKRI